MNKLWLLSNTTMPSLKYLAYQMNGYTYRPPKLDTATGAVLILDMWTRDTAIFLATGYATSSSFQNQHPSKYGAG